jgi:hypothetical protein
MLTLPPVFDKVAPLLAIAGLIWFLGHALVAVQGIYARILRPGKNIKKTFGEWAVVTGGNFHCAIFS